MKQQFRFASIALLSALTVGCASMSAGSLFSHYSAQNKAIYQAVKSEIIQRLSKSYQITRQATSLITLKEAELTCWIKNTLKVRLRLKWLIRRLLSSNAKP